MHSSRPAARPRPWPGQRDLGRWRRDGRDETRRSLVDLPAGESVEFKPGSYHVMLMGLSNDLTVGGTIELDLVFEHAGTVVVKAEIRQS